MSSAPQLIHPWTAYWGIEMESAMYGNTCTARNTLAPAANVSELEGFTELTPAEQAELQAFSLRFGNAKPRFGFFAPKPWYISSGKSLEKAIGPIAKAWGTPLAMIATVLLGAGAITSAAFGVLTAYREYQASAAVAAEAQANAQAQARANTQYAAHL